MNNYSIEFIRKFIDPVKDNLRNGPNSVSLEVTTRCQLDCIYCSRNKDKIEDLDLEKVPYILQHLSEVENIVICGMGESFCYPYLYQLLELIKDYKVTIITNGAVKIDFTELTRYGNVKLLVFSIDATTKEQLERICKGYHYENLIHNLENLRKYPAVIGIINTTLVQENISEITNIVLFAKTYRLQAVNFGLAIGDSGFIELNKELINKEIRRGMKEANRLGVIFNPFHRISCHSRNRVQPAITLDGKLFACCNLINHNDWTGNIYEEDIQTIWKEEATVKINKESSCYDCELVKNLWRVME